MIKKMESNLGLQSLDGCTSSKSPTGMGLSLAISIFSTIKRPPVSGPQLKLNEIVVSKVMSIKWKCSSNLVDFVAYIQLIEKLKWMMFDC